MEVKITLENFDEEVLKSEIPVIVDFYADWCGPCKMLAPELEAVAKELEGKVKIGKINVDEQGELANAFPSTPSPPSSSSKTGRKRQRTLDIARRRRCFLCLHKT